MQGSINTLAALKKGSYSALDLLWRELKNYISELLRIWRMEWNTSCCRIIEVIETNEIEVVYDIEMPNHHNFFANGMLAHNCHIKRKKLLEIIRDSECLVIGLSGTPFPKWLGTYYTNLVKVTTMRQMIDAGYLSDFELYVPDAPNMKGAPTTNLAGFGEDYQAEYAARIMGDNKIVGNIVGNWLANGRDLPTIAFCVNVAHAKIVTLRFRDNGVNAEIITADTPKIERDEIIQRFRDGVVKILVNVGIFVAGFDEDVRCIIFAYPTKSEIRWIQCCGRGLRLAKGKETCLIFDHSGTYHRLGAPDEIEYGKLGSSNDGMADESSFAKQEEQVEKLSKKCSKCPYIKPAGVCKCPQCGYTPMKGEDVQADETRELVQAKGKKKEFTRDQQIDWWRSFLGYHAERAAAGKPISIGWCFKAYSAKFGVEAKNMPSEPMAPTPEVRSYIQYLNMKYAKGKAKARK